MKKLYTSFSLLLLIGLTCHAQNTGGSVRSTGSASSSAQAGKTINLDSATSVDAQLQKSLDVKKARVGDQIVLKTAKAIKQNGETVVPKGSSLIGRITDVQERTKDNKMSRIGMVFDRLEGKSLSTPITATILSITGAQAAVAVGDALSAGAAGSSQSSGSVSSGGASGGGLLGGVGSTVGGVTNTVGGLANTATQTVGGVTNTAGETLRSTTGTVGSAVNGIRISNDVSGSVNGSTTLSAADKNIKLDKGATFHLRLSNQGENSDRSPSSVKAPANRKETP